MDPDYAVKYKNPLYKVAEGRIEHFVVTLTCSDRSDQSCVCVEKEFPTRRGMASAQETARVLVRELKNCMDLDTDEIVIRKIYTGE